MSGKNHAFEIKAAINFSICHHLIQKYKRWINVRSLPSHQLGTISFLILLYILIKYIPYYHCPIQEQASPDDLRQNIKPQEALTYVFSHGIVFLNSKFYSLFNDLIAYYFTTGIQVSIQFLHRYTLEIQFF